MMPTLRLLIYKIKDKVQVPCKVKLRLISCVTI